MCTPLCGVPPPSTLEELWWRGEQYTISACWISGRLRHLAAVVTHSLSIWCELRHDKKLAGRAIQSNFCLCFSVPPLPNVQKAIKGHERRDHPRWSLRQLELKTRLQGSSPSPPFWTSERMLTARRNGSGERMKDACDVVMPRSRPKPLRCILMDWRKRLLIYNSWRYPRQAPLYAGQAEGMKWLSMLTRFFEPCGKLPWGWQSERPKLDLGTNCLIPRRGSSGNVRSGLFWKKWALNAPDHWIHLIPNY